MCVPPSPCVAALAVVVFVACGDGARPGAVVIRRDSAGIEIVETPEAQWSEEQAWTVDTVPSLSIGETEGDPAYLFGSVAGAVRLDDGSIAVADGQAMVIRFYDAAGVHMRGAGGPGGGPGEFGSLHALRDCGEGRLYADDRRRQRVLVWNERGELQRAFDLHEPTPGRTRGPYRWVCAPTGEIMAAGWGDLRQTVSITKSQFFSQPAHIWVLDSLAQPLLDLGEHVISERVLLYNQRTGGGTSAPHPFGRAASFALAADRIYVGTAERLEVAVFDRTGAQVRTLRGPAVDLSFGPDALQEYREAAQDEGDRALLDRIVEAQLELPATLPAYTGMRIDPLGYLWVERFQRPRDVVGEWGVFAPDGVFLGHVTMPAGFEVHDIGRDYVLGVTRDQLGVARARVQPLHRTSAR